MSHDDPRELLAAYAEEAVDADERRAVEALLAQSPEAHAELAMLRETLSVLREVATTDDAGPEPDWNAFGARLGGAFDAIDDERRDGSWRRWFRQWWTAPAFGAAFAAVALLAVLASNGDDGAPTDQVASIEPTAAADESAGADPGELDPFSDEALLADDLDPFGDEALALDPFGDEALALDPFGDEALALDPFGDTTGTAEPFAADASALLSGDAVVLWSDAELSWIDELDAAELDRLAAALSALEAG